MTQDDNDKKYPVSDESAAVLLADESPAEKMASETLASDAKHNTYAKPLLASMVFSLVIVSVAIFYLKKSTETLQLQQSSQLDSIQAQLNNTLNDYQTLSAQIQTQQQNAAQALTTQQQNLQTTMTQQLADFSMELEKQRLQMQTLAEPRVHDWPLQEALQLLQVANRKLQIEHDVATAIALLTDIDRILKQMPDSDIQYLQQAIKEQLAELRAFNAVDLADNARALVALFSQVAKLTFNMVQLPQAVADKPLAASPDYLDKFWAAVKKDWIVIERRSQPVKPLLSSDQQFLVQQNMVLALQQAQWALLHEKSDLYQTMLQQVLTWIEQFYVLDDARTKAFVTEIQRLQQLRLDEHYPDLYATMALFNKEWQTRLQRQMPASELPK